MEQNKSEQTPAHPENKPDSSNQGANRPSAINGLAVAAMAVGIVAFISGWVPFWGLIAGIAAIILGAIAVKKSSGAGKGMAIAGIVTGAIATVWSLIVSFILIFAIIAGTASLGVFGSAINDAKQAVEQQEQQVKDAEEAKKHFAKGETGVFNKFEVKINSVKRNFADPDGMYKPSNGKEYVLVNITVKNIGEEPKYSSSFDFKVNEAGVATTNTYVSTNDDFSGGEISPGASVSGNLVYEVTKGANDLKIQYSTSVISIKEGGIKTLVYTLAI